MENVGGRAPVKTYIKEAPYYVPGSMPSIFFNMTKEGLNNADVRKAIAMAIDYGKISSWPSAATRPQWSRR